MSAVQDLGLSDIKRMPADKLVRQEIRRVAAELARGMDAGRPPAWDDLANRGRTLLLRLAYPESYLGYAMVSLANAFWTPRFQAVPPERRLFLLPHCLSDKSTCPGRFDAEGLHCAGCGSCDIAYLKAKAESLGYSILVAEGTPSVILRILEGSTDAILGVACLDSLESSFLRISELGIPYIAVPLLTNGCERTQAEIDQIEANLSLVGDSAGDGPRSYLKLLRETARLFDAPVLADLISPHVTRPNPDAPAPISATQTIALDWLTSGGKRLRPFITVAAYAVGRWGGAALESSFDPVEAIPPEARRLAVAIEAMHKASLIHDDIEDDDEYRYGRKTVHRSYGVGPAINVGDYLVGLGYRLVAGDAESLGAARVADIVSQLATAHIDLCRGQGAELLWQSPELRPLDALQAYSLKTTPAFQVALYAGLRAAGCEVDMSVLNKYCIYVGEAYQVLNDLDDWEDFTDSGHSLPGLDALAQRPTILRAFALEAGGRADLEKLAASQDTSRAVPAIGALYESLGAFEKAEKLYARLRERALEASTELDSADLRDLFGFLARLVLPRRTHSRERWVDDSRLS